MKRDQGGVTSLDTLAMGLESGEVTRSMALKLGGSALLATTLGIFAAEENAQAAIRRRHCARRRHRTVCRSGGHWACCRRHERCCTGKQGAACCSSGQKCNQGKCVG